MATAKTFEVNGERYNIARAGAVAQDEVLSLLTQGLIQRFVAAGEAGIEADESVLFAMVLAMPFQLKNKIDSLLMSRVFKEGTDLSLTMKDFDGRVMDYNRLRTQVLMWNLEGFFTYWAEERSAAIEAMENQTQP